MEIKGACLEPEQRAFWELKAFEVEKCEALPPPPNITQPHGGTIWNVGGSYDIKWEDGPETPVRLFISINDVAEVSDVQEDKGFGLPIEGGRAISVCLLETLGQEVRLPWRLHMHAYTA
eukprot:1160994-Pelagomonas_calceolata.AAC.12